jgi:poly(glycerol-phosphate) alpha-glucosyltransferase
MRVTFLTGSLSRQAGGFFPILQRLSYELMERGCDVTALGIEDSDFAADRAGWRCRETRVFKTVGPARLAYSRTMGDALLQHDADLIHLHGLWMGISALNHRWHRKTRRPYIISAHGMLNRWAVGHQHWKKRLAGMLYENRNLRDAGCLHALSVQELEDYRSYGLKNPVAVIPNGVDLPDESGCDRDAPWNDFAPEGSRILLFLGRLHPKKGLIELLEGWKLSGRARQSWRLVIAGWDDGGHQIEMEERIRELHLEKEVKIVGPQFGEDKTACLAKADAFVLTSHSEGLPVAVLEAWGHRLPAIITPACNLLAGFERRAAIRVEPQETSIAGGLEMLFSMTDEGRAAMGGCGRRLVEDCFTWLSITDQMMATYRWVLGIGEKPECVSL